MEVNLNTLQHTTTHCNEIETGDRDCMLRTRFLLSKTHRITLQHTATHCNTLQHTATHCNAHPLLGAEASLYTGIGEAYLTQHARVTQHTL